MGVVYWIGFAMAMAVVAATVGVIVATVVILGILIVAVFAWIRSLRTAVRTGDHRWLRDLILAPAAGILSAALIGRGFQHFANTEINAFLDRTVNAPDASIFVQIAPLPFGILFFVCLFALPGTLAKDGPRWLAYPGFVFYSVYLTALGFQAADALKDSDLFAYFRDGDDAFVGQWQGVVNQPRSGPYTVQVTLSESGEQIIGQVTYPELACGGTWTEQQRFSGTRQFTENIDPASPGSCYTGSPVAVYEQDDGRLEAIYLDPTAVNTTVAATVMLERFG